MRMRWRGRPSDLRGVRRDPRTGGGDGAEGPQTAGYRPPEPAVRRVACSSRTRRGKPCGLQERHLETRPGHLNEPAGGFPEERGMERLRTPRAIRTRLDRMMKRQTLDDRTQFSRPGFFGEIPFYARYYEIAFLEDFARSVSDRILLSCGLDYLKQLLDRDHVCSHFFAALTVERDDRHSPLVPKIFVSHGTTTEDLPANLPLREPRTLLGRMVARLVRALDPASRYLILEDVETVAASPRIFVGPDHETAPGWLTIDAMRRHVATASVPRVRCSQGRLHRI